MFVCTLGGGGRRQGTWCPLSAGDQRGGDVEEKQSEARSAQSKGCAAAGNQLLTLCPFLCLPANSLAIPIRMSSQGPQWQQ